MKNVLLNLANTNKGHNMLCDIKDAYVEVLKYHIRRNEGANFAFKTNSCAEADVILIKAIAKFIAKAEGISANLRYVDCGINDVQFGVTIADNILGRYNHNALSYSSIKIESEFKRDYTLFNTLLHEIVHWTQDKMMDYEFDSCDIDYDKRKHEIQAFFISDCIIDMMQGK